LEDKSKQNLINSDSVAHWRKTQRLVLLRCLLGGGYLDFGEGPEEEDPQGPKLVNRRLSSGWGRFVGMTYPKTRANKKNVVSTTPFG
jgi:hypothetical protein